MALRFGFSKASGGEPLPTLPVTFIDDGGRTTPTVLAVLDTGADGTFAPLSILKNAGFRPGRKRRNMLAVNETSVLETVSGYVLTLQIGALALPEIDVFGSREVTDVIIGRDVLNQLVFTYNGPQRILEILIHD